MREGPWQGAIWYLGILIISFLLLVLLLFFFFFFFFGIHNGDGTEWTGLDWTGRTIGQGFCFRETSLPWLLILVCSFFLDISLLFFWKGAGELICMLYEETLIQRQFDARNPADSCMMLP